jgi:hypothetical protein
LIEICSPERVCQNVCKNVTNFVIRFKNVERCDDVKQQKCENNPVERCADVDVPVKKKISEEVCKDNEKPGYFDKTFLELTDFVPPLKISPEDMPPKIV